MPRPRKIKPTVLKHIRQNTKQSNHQSVVVHLGKGSNRARKRRNPPLRSSNKSLDVRHIHYYNTPTSNPLIREDNEAVRKMRAEINELKAERDKNNTAKAKTAETATSFTQTNPILNKGTPKTPPTPETPENNHPPSVTPLKRKNESEDDEHNNKYQMVSYSSPFKRAFEGNNPIRKPPNPPKKKKTEIYV
jgi:hypothetical protein